MSAQRVLLTLVLLPFVPLAALLYACVYVFSVAWTLAWDTAGGALSKPRT